MSSKVLSSKQTGVLSENSLLRYITFIGLYFSQGIPEGLTLLAIPAWLAMNGKSVVEIATYSAAIMIPFSLKILLAPMIERYTYLPMGRRRPWLLFGQFGILCSMIALSLLPNPLDNIFQLTVIVLCIHVFMIFQDIATDSLVIDIVPLEQQGKANSFMWGSKTVGSAISLFAGSWIINQYGFSNAVFAMSIFVLLIMFVPLFLRERKGEKLLPFTAGKTSTHAAELAIDSWSKLFKSFKQVILLPNSLLLIVSVFLSLAAIHFMRTLLPVFTIQELGWTDVYYSRVMSICGIVGGVSGMVIGAIVIQKFGVMRMLQGSLFLLSLTVLVLAFASTYWTSKTFVIVFIGLLLTLTTLVNIGVLAQAMRLCWKRISAMQFTFCMTIFNFGLGSGAALFGFIKSHYTWQTLFMLFTFLIFISMFILKFIKTERHLGHVEMLERKYNEILQKEGNLLVKSDSIYMK